MTAPDAPSKDGRITIDAPPLPVTIHSQYVKDLSFENPNAPDSLNPGQKGPELDMNINLETRRKDGSGGELYEVLMTLKASAMRDGKTVFLAEIVYGALVSLPANVPSEKMKPILFIEVPQILFPFARHILATVTAAGGYPPLILNPVDFRGMYAAREAVESAAPSAAVN